MATTTITRRLLTIGTATALTLGAAACGGGSNDTTTADTDEISATLAIITTNIETDRDARGFEPATEGETLTVGDQVRTDPTGFAELTYHDGSWQRIENSATLTIDELTNAGDTNTVRTSVDVGDTWNRVETLTEPDDTYELDTPVATAAVRGTAFATSCPTADECTFSVIEGTVEITPRTGDPLTLTAGQQITITTDTPPGEPTDPGVDTLQQDPFIAENLDLDQTKTTDTSSDSEDEGPGEGERSLEEIDTCALLTQAEVEALLARPVTTTESRPPMVVGGAPTCSWDTGFIEGEGGSQRVALSIGASPAPEPTTVSSGERCQQRSVEGLARSATLVECAPIATPGPSYDLLVFTGDAEVTVSVSSARVIQEAEVRSIAELVLDQL